MLQFITGEKGSGKTTYAHRLLAQKVQDEDLQAVLLVPRQFTFESDKGVLDAMGPKAACAVEVLSFSRLSDVVFKTVGGPKRPLLGEGANAALLALALSSLQEQLQVFRRHTQSIGFLKKLLRQIADFKQNLVDAPALFAAADALPQGHLQQKLRETALIYQTYDALVAQRFFDDNDVLTLVAEKLKESDLFEGKVVVIDDFSTFSKQEFAVLAQILRRAKDVYVTLCTDDLFDPNPLSPFAVTNRTGRQLRSLARQCGTDIGIPVHLPSERGDFASHESPALRHLAKHLYDPLLPAFSGDCAAVTLCTAPSVREECDLAAQRIRQLLRAGVYRCRDIAVVFRTADTYAKQVRTSLNKCGVPIFEDRRAPVENEPLMILVRSLLSICAGGFSTEQLMRYLKTGLTGIGFDEIAALENYALLWDIGGAAWQSDWTQNPDGFGAAMDEKRKETLALLNETRKAAVSPIAALREQMRGETAKTQMRLLYAFLRDTGIDEALKAYALQLEADGEIELALEQDQIWSLLMETLNEIACALDDAVPQPQLLLDIFDLIVSTRSLGKLPDGYDEVYICDAARIATQSPKVTFVLGMNAGVFPLTPDDTALFSRNEAQTLKEWIDAFDDDGTQAAMTERFLVYNALASAREKLFVSWSLTAPSGEKRSESEAVLLLLRLLPDVPVQSALSAPSLLLCEGEQPAFEHMARFWHRNDGEEAALKQYFSLQPAYREKVAAIKRATAKTAFHFEDPAKAKALFGRQIRLSATQLETFALCPFRYFCRYGVKAKPRQIAKLDPASSGTIVHYVLEKLLKNHSGSAFASLDKAAARQEISQILQTYMETYMGGAAQKSKRFLYLYARLEKTLCAIVERLLEEFKNSEFAPWGFEIRIDRGGEIEPYTVPLADGLVELHGVVDRIDKMDKDGKRYIRVVDYKTGTKSFSLSDVLGGLGMQMLLYLVGIWRSDNEKYRDVIPAGVLYLPARLEPFAASRGDDETAITQKKLAGGKMDGMLLDDGTALKGMDASLAGTFLPVSVSKSGAIKGNFISLEQLGKLAKRMDSIMAQMGAHLHGGKIEARPVVGTGHGDTCEWCDFASVCRRERDGAFRYLEKRTHDACLEDLDGGDAQ